MGNHLLGWLSRQPSEPAAHPFFFVPGRPEPVTSAFWAIAGAQPINETLTMFGRRPGKPSTLTSRKDAWCRSDEWDAAARTEFETRLGRSRPHNRVQYRRIKAISLLRSGDPKKEAAGRDLLEQVIADRDAYLFEKVIAHSLLAEHEHDAGNLDDAERHLRMALGMMSETHGSGGSELEEVRLAEILTTRGERSQLIEARDVLDRLLESPPLFLVSRFRMCLAGVKVSLALNDKERAATWASMALDIAGATHSGLQNHPDLGLVETDEQTRAWLTAIAARPT